MMEQNIDKLNLFDYVDGKLKENDNFKDENDIFNFTMFMMYFTSNYDRKIMLDFSSKIRKNFILGTDELIKPLIDRTKDEKLKTLYINSLFKPEKMLLDYDEYKLNAYPFRAVTNKEFFEYIKDNQYKFKLFNNK